MNRQKYLDIIEFPDFMWLGDHEISKALFLAIVDAYYKAVSTDLLDDIEIEAQRIKAQFYNKKIKDVLTPEEYLQTWLDLGKLIGSWMKFAKESENWETCANIKKVFYDELAGLD